MHQKQLCDLHAVTTYVAAGKKAAIVITCLVGHLVLNFKHHFSNLYSKLKTICIQGNKIMQTFKSKM